MRVEFTLIGATPLLFHADDVEQSDTLQAWRKDTANRAQSVAGDDRSPPWTWQTYLYSDGTRLAWPSANLMVALRAAGAQVVLKKQKTYKEITQSGLFVAREFLAFTTNGKPVLMADIEAMRSGTFKQQTQEAAKLGFRLWCKRARVGQAKHVRVRARFETWEMVGELEVQPHAADSLTYERIQELFVLASRVGMGDWRPGCKTPGPFGTFDVRLKRIK